MSSASLYARHTGWFVHDQIPISLMLQLHSSEALGELLGDGGIRFPGLGLVVSHFEDALML
jgi:hypothetical protein